MTRISWLYLLIAVALAGVVGYFTLQSVRRTPVDLLEAAVRNSSGPDRNLKLALSDLDLAVRLAEVDAEDEVVARILMERARVLAELDAWSRARVDLQSVLERYRPGDIAVESQLILADLRCGEPERALRRSDKVLAREPARVDALTYRGQVLVSLADGAMRECEALIQKALADERAARASALAHQIAGMTADEPRRVSLLLDLRGLFNSSQEMVARDIVRLLDGASQQIAQAREALASAFLGPPLRQTLEDYLRLLERSARPAEMIAFGLTAVHHPGARSYPHFYERLLKALRSEGRPDLAAETMELNFPQGAVPTPELYEVWSDVLYLDKRWHSLTEVGVRLREAPGHERQSRGFFYTGVAHTYTDQHSYATFLLQRFVQRMPHEPRPGDLAKAWHTLALNYQKQDLLVAEKNALRAALQIDPDGGHQAGLGWRRLATVLRLEEPSSVQEIDHALTQAVRLLPEISSEVVREWEEACREHLEASQVDLKGEFQRLQEEERLSPARPASAYELYSLARMHAARRNPAGVAACARRLLADYPGFLPALDMLLVASLQLGEHQRAAELVLERLTLDPTDKRVLRQVNTLPPDAWTRAQDLRLMQLDPEGQGRMRVAAYLHAAGRESEALEGLLAVDPDLLGDESRLLAAQLMLKLGRLEGIEPILEGIAPRSPQRVESLPLWIEASMRRGERELTQVRVAALATESELASERWVHLVDAMLLEGYDLEADGLLLLLDGRKDTRNGEILLRRALSALLLGRAEESVEHLMRAEAFLADGGVEHGLIQLALERSQWRALPLLVEALERSGLPLGDLQAAALAVLAGRTDEALERSASAGDRQAEPLWLLVESAARAMRAEPLPGSEEGSEPSGRVDLARSALAETQAFLVGGLAGERDPRHAMGIVLALLDPTWRPLALARAKAHPVGSPGGVWPAYIAARAHVDAGQPDAALELLRQLMRPNAPFEPAWDLHERALALLSAGRGVAELGLPAARLGEMRREIFGPRPQDASAELWRLVVQAEAGGASEKALELAQRARELDPDPVAGSLRLALLHLRRNEISPALEALEAAIGQQEPVSDSVLVAEILGRWHQLGGLVDTPAQIRKLRSLQDMLLRRFPRDPLLALFLAQADLVDPQLSNAVGLARSFERFQSFRRATANEPLEQLREGATRAWFDFLVERDPKRAEALVQGELLQLPGSRDLWRMLGHAQLALGKRQEASVTFESMLRMLPDGATARSLLALYARSGRRTERVQQLVDEIVRMERLPGPDIALELERARALVLEGAKTRDEGILLLADLWSRRQGANDRRTATDIGLVYGTALCWRGAQGDAAGATEVLSEILPEVEDPTERNLVQAMANLAARLR